MKRQTRKDREDESRGMRRAMRDRYEDRREDRRRDREGAFGVRDNEQAYEVRDIDSNEQDRGMGRVEDLPRSDRGYAPEAWHYEY